MEYRCMHGRGLGSTDVALLFYIMKRSLFLFSDCRHLSHTEGLSTIRILLFQHHYLHLS